MPPWTFYPAFLATILSVVGLSYLAVKEHTRDAPRTLSQLATKTPQTLRYFRAVLWTCGTLFAITMYWFVIPRITHGALQAVAWSLTYIPEVLLAAFPARGKSLRHHEIFSVTMGFGMLASAYLFAWSFHGVVSGLELGIAGAMSVLAMLANFDQKRFLFYELPFIYLAHTSIVIAALAR